MNVKRITRLLKLLQILQAGRGQNARGLARDCGMSRRTMFRDMEALRVAGVPIVFDREHDRYSIPSTHFLPPINFSAAEALSLVSLASEMGRGDRLPFYESARTAALKLEDSMPQVLREQLRDMTRAIRIQPTPVSPLRAKEQIYQHLVDARGARRIVRIQYDRHTESQRIVTKLRPYHLLFCRHSWYVIGRSSLHHEVKTFNVKRIVALEMLHETFTIPRRFSMERYLRNAWLLIPADGPDHHVVIRFRPLVASNVAEVTWHRTQQIEFQDDGSLTLSVTVSGLNEIVWWILAYGDQAEVLKPERLHR